MENRGDSPKPSRFGFHHPCFTVTSLATGRFKGLPERCLNQLTMAEASTAEQTARLAQGIDLLVRPGGALELVDPEASTCLTLEPSPPGNLVVIWSEPPRPMVCLETWSGPRQALFSGDRRLELAPGEQQTLPCRYALFPAAS